MKKLLLSIFAVLLIIEEWLWDGLNHLAHKLVKLLRLESFERWLMGLSPAQSVIAFVIPLLVVMPINLLALGLLVHGMVFQGVLLEVFAKLFGTLFISRVFSLTKRQLITYKIINSTYTLISRWLAWAHRKVVETPIYKKPKIIKEPLKNCRFAQQSFKNLVVNFNIWQFFHQNSPFFSKISPFLGLFSNFRRNQASTFISIPSNDIGNRGQKGQAGSIFG